MTFDKKWWRNTKAYDIIIFIPLQPKSTLNEEISIKKIIFLTQQAQRCIIPLTIRVGAKNNSQFN